MLAANISHVSWLLLAVVLEIFANIMLKQSQGLRRPGYALLSILAVLAAFSALGEAVKGIDLAVAYALWGAMGIIATLAAGSIMFGQKLGLRAAVGVVILIIGIVMIKVA